MGTFSTRQDCFFKQDNVRTKTESVQCHHVFDIAYLEGKLRGLGERCNLPAGSVPEPGTVRELFQSKINTMQSNVRYCMSTTDKYRAVEPRYL